LVDRRDSLWWGMDDWGRLALTGRSLGVEFDTASLDPEVHHRRRRLHWSIGREGGVRRTDPIGKTPTEFLDEWLASPWPDASAWLAHGADPKELEAAHAFDANAFEGGTMRCRFDENLWQVGVKREGALSGAGGHRYFRIHWSPPYRFRMQAVSPSPFPGCNLPATVSGDDSEKPAEVWHPAY
jgi:hypothetical protein